MKSEIRQSEIIELQDRVRKGKYNKYLQLMKIDRLRGLSNVEVRLDFPVTALIGPNGGGKSTVLGAAACAYKDTKPGNFFPKSSLGDSSMSGWKVEYELIDREKQNGNPNLKRSVRFKDFRWVRSDNMLSREMFYFGIGRTVAVNERSEFKKLMTASYRHRGNLGLFQDEVAKQIEHILGKSVAKFQKTNVSDDGTITFYIGNNQEQEYSEFHFGAGESSIIRIVSAIENSPPYSLILIEELENGLHPIATRRFVEYLIDSAKRKSNQVIFTTHSDEALIPLPDDAIWACFDGKVQQGKLSIKALRAISGKIDKILPIFVEDKFAEIIVEAVIQILLGKDFVDQIAVYALNGDGMAVKVHRNRENDPAAEYKSLCIIDGDSQQKDSPEERILRLPGQQPEATVFQNIEQNIDSWIALLTVFLQLMPTRQEEVKTVVKSVSSICRDPHLYFEQIAIQLGFLSTNLVQNAFVKLWIQQNTGLFDNIISAIKKELSVFQKET